MDNRFHFGLIKAILVVLFLHFAIKRYTIAHEVVSPHNLAPSQMPTNNHSGSDISQEDIRAKMRDFLSSLEDEDVVQGVSTEQTLAGADRDGPQEYTSYEAADARPDELLPGHAAEAASSQRPDMRQTEVWSGVAPFESSTDLYAFVE